MERLRYTTSGLCEAGLNIEIRVEGIHSSSGYPNPHRQAKGGEGGGSGVGRRQVNETFSLPHNFSFSAVCPRLGAASPLPATVINYAKTVVMGTCHPYMSSLNYCNQTKYENKQSLLWNLCVLLTYIFCYCESLSFYVNNYTIVGSGMQDG